MLKLAGSHHEKDTKRYEKTIRFQASWLDLDLLNLTPNYPNPNPNPNPKPFSELLA